MGRRMKMSEVEKAAREYADGLRSVDKKNTYDNIEVDSSRMRLMRG